MHYPESLNQYAILFGEDKVEKLYTKVYEEHGPLMAEYVTGETYDALLQEDIYQQQLLVKGFTPEEVAEAADVPVTQVRALAKDRKTMDAAVILVIGDVVEKNLAGALDRALQEGLSTEQVARIFALEEPLVQQYAAVLLRADTADR